MSEEGREAFLILKLKHLALLPRDMRGWVADVSLVASSAQCSRRWQRRRLLVCLVCTFFFLFLSLLFSTLACSLSFSMLSWTRGKGCCIFFFSIIISLVALASCGRHIDVQYIKYLLFSYYDSVWVCMCQIHTHTHTQGDRILSSEHSSSVRLNETRARR